MTHNIIGEHYKTIGELGRGGFGQTYLAEDLRVGNFSKCVIKQLNPQSNDPNIVTLAGRLFKQEAESLYQLGKHDQIPALIDYFEENGEFYLVQEYVEGTTFSAELRTGKIFNQGEVYQIIIQLLDVLSFVHRHGVIHRDIKPSNLMRRNFDQKIVLIDFGAVKQIVFRADHSIQTTQATIAIGSDGFTPMEQLAGHPKFASDIYAVGMLAIQLLTQTHPARFVQNQRTYEWIWQDKVSVNPFFAEILSRMVRIDYRQRFANADEALNELRKVDFQKNVPINQINQTENVINYPFQVPPTIKDLLINTQKKIGEKLNKILHSASKSPAHLQPDKKVSHFEKKPLPKMKHQDMIWYGFLLILLVFGISMIWRLGMSI